MSDLFMNMQQRRPDAALANAKQYKSKRSYNKNGYDPDIYSNNKCSTSVSSDSRTPATRCSSQRSTTTANTTATENDGDANADVDDEFANVLSLQLRKPKHWRWELSTSRSCSNIALPRILLYDHKGQLLVDVDSQEEQCYTQPQTKQRTTQNGTDAQPSARKRVNKAITSNLANSIRKALDRQFTGLQIQEATPSPVTSQKHSTVTTPITEFTSTPTSAIDFYTNELPDYKLQQRANSLKGVRFKVNDDADGSAGADVMKNTHNSFNLADLPTPPSTITTTTTPTNSSSSGPREKRRYRRSHSSGRSPGTSESILERFSFNKGRFSSPEYAAEQEVHHAPRYFLRTCKAGTLVVQEESFSRYRRRRKPRNSSTENIQSGSSKSSLKMSDSGKQRQLKSVTTNAVEMTDCPCGSLLNMAELQAQSERKKVYPVRRYRSDGNVLLHQHPISSDDEREREQMRAREAEKMKRTQRRYENLRKQSKRELIMIDPENCVRPSVDTPESR